MIYLEMKLIDEINWGFIYFILFFLIKKLLLLKKIKCVGVGGFVYNIYIGI